MNSANPGGQDVTQSARSSPRFIRLVESFCFLLFKANRNTGFHSVSQLNVSIQVQSSSAEWKCSPTQPPIST